MEVISRVVAGVVGVAGAGVVQRNREPLRRAPWSSRFAVRTGDCQAGQRSTSVCSWKTLLDACAPLRADGPATPFDGHLEGHRQWAGEHPAPPAALRRALTFWTRLHGVLSLELAGHFAGMGFDATLFFESELQELLASGT
ncbi:TetR-like C-terminal domain-containing protein [Nonomuraea sp. NPDC050202]|uniref:TetR-like C-terminal domain-containing protein n=1 Tax=Nonomuraea sp. NPDC050202 TaxID=3155035 RepID=UPI0033CF2B25